ncbi:hypothetical protein H4582DRAFT_2056006 [Lactarius indigo]|nr:hypothetical protein H4582DRAFT_2056006 [Lactarius indigo]
MYIRHQGGMGIDEPVHRSITSRGDQRLLKEGAKSRSCNARPAVREKCIRRRGLFSEVMSIGAIRETFASIPRTKEQWMEVATPQIGVPLVGVWFVSVRRTGPSCSRQIMYIQKWKSRSFHPVSGSHDVHGKGLVPLTKLPPHETPKPYSIRQRIGSSDHSSLRGKIIHPKPHWKVIQVTHWELGGPGNDTTNSETFGGAWWRVQKAVTLVAWFSEKDGNEID